MTSTEQADPPSAETGRRFRRRTGRRGRRGLLLPLVGAVVVVALLVTLGVVITNRNKSGPMKAAPVAAAAAASPTPTAAPSAQSSPSPSAPAAIDASADLKRALDEHLGSRSGDISAFATDLTTGKTVAYGQEGGMATASMVKLDILLTLLMQKQDAGKMPSASERSTAGLMIRQSDNNAATALWNAVGRGPAITTVNIRLGLTATVPGESSYWGSTETSARDQVRLMSSLYSPTGPLTPAYRSFALDLLTHVASDQQWGVSKAGDSGTPALKNGWLPRTKDGNRWVVTSVGHVTAGGREIVLSVLSRRSATMPAGIDLIEDVSVRLRDALATETRAS